MGKIEGNDGAEAARNQGGGAFGAAGGMKGPSSAFPAVCAYGSRHRHSTLPTRPCALASPSRER